MNYFELYDTPMNLFLDEAKLKGQFYALSKKYHPDINQGTDPEAYIKTLEMSSLVNTAYKTLTDFDLRLKYILEELAVHIDPNESLPPNFLMEMMELNEEMMEATQDETKKQALLTQIEQRETSLKDKAMLAWEALDIEALEGTLLDDLKSIYFQRKYLLRIRKNLNSFVPD